MQKIKTMVRQRSQSIEDGGVSGQGQGQGQGSSHLVVSGPMAGQLVSPGGLSEGDRVEEGDEEEYTTRARRSEDDEIFGGMSPDKERAYTPPARQGGHGQRF